MGKYSIIIAIEKYRDKGISNLPFIEADGKELKSVLLKLGFSESSINYLLNEDATKTNIESELRNTLNRLDDEDEFTFFFSGHGFSKNDSNYIATYDSKKGDLENTSISLQYIFNLIKKCKSKKIVFFLDSCHSGLPFDATMKDITTSMTDQEMNEFFNKSEYTIGFASCRTNEISYTSQALSHSIWTYHLIQALSGNEHKIITNSKYILASSLQDYLSDVVPKSVVKYRTSGIQNPVMFGNLSRNFIIADLTQIVEEKRKKKLTSPIKLDRALFSYENIGTIRTLSGFIKKIHRVPEYSSNATERFVKDIASHEIKNIVDSTIKNIRNSFNYTRKEIDHELPFGEGKISTPDFEFYVSINQSSDDPTEYIERVELYNITSLEIINSDEFNMVFNNYFDTIEFNFQKSVKVEDLIDNIETLNNKKIKIIYPPDCSNCKISIDGIEDTITITNWGLKISRGKKLTPKVLTKSLEVFRNEIQKYDELKKLI